MKIIQNTRFLSGKRKYTIANADSSEMMIFPIAMVSAVIRLTHSMGATGAMVDPPEVFPPNSASR